MEMMQGAGKQTGALALGHWYWGTGVPSGEDEESYRSCSVGDEVKLPM